MTNGTVEVGTGGLGSKFIRSKYPVEEGLEAGTTKQTGSEQPVDNVW